MKNKKKKLADGRKFFINLQTGEVVKRFTRLFAYLYFKADGRRFNYQSKWNDVISYAQFNEMAIDLDIEE